MTRSCLVALSLAGAVAAAGLAIPAAVAQTRAFVPVTRGGQSATAGPIGVVGKAMPPAVTGHNAIYVFALP